MCPDAIKAAVERLARNQADLVLVENSGQCYVRVNGLPAPSPPWNKTEYDVLIPAPLAYETAGLDAFYLRLPYTYKNGDHPRINGPVIKVDGADWRLVSWHYAEGKPWRAGSDNLETHISHVTGFFLHRGAANAM